MKHLLRSVVFIAGFALGTMRAVASPDIDNMSDIEVSEYAAQMSSVMENIRYYRLCTSHDTTCMRAEFARHGISYEDKNSVQKRMVLMISSIY